jgi:hypothetical protein
MKTTMKFLGMGLALIAITLTSCSKDGEIGPMGPAGQDGLNGTDGNANVRLLTFDYSGVSANDYIQEIPELTQEVLDNDLILGYITTKGAMYQIPQNNIGINVTDSGDRVIQTMTTDVRVKMAPQSYHLYFYRSGTSYSQLLPKRSFIKLKIIIAKSSSITGKTNKETIRTELKSAGVDINDYYAVMDYFGLEYQ